MIFSDSCNYGSNLNAKPQRINSTHLIKIKKNENSLCQEKCSP